MRTPATMRRSSITLPPSGSYELPAAGDFLFVEIASSDMTARVEKVGDGRVVADGILVRTAAGYRFQTFYDRIVLTGTAGATATLWTGEGEGNLNLLSGSVSISNAAGSTLASPADVSIAASASLDLAADPTIRERILQVPSSNTGELCVRDQTGTTSAGLRLNPTGGLLFLVWGNSGALRIRNNTAAAQSVFQLNNQA